MTQAAKAGVIPGSMLCALNGINIMNLGGTSIHEKAATLGLPLRITFKKPTSVMPPGSENNDCREEIVNRCINLLKDPSRWDLSQQQKRDLCQQQGAKPSEIAASIFLAQYMVKK